MDTNNFVLTEVKNNIGIISLNRPIAYNALAWEMVIRIRKILHKWKTDDSIKIILFKSSFLKAFCSGGDVKALYEHALKDDYEYMIRYLSNQYLMDYEIHTFPKPIIVFMDGLVMGGGLGLAFGADYKIVTENTKISTPENKIGFFPDTGSSYFLSKLKRNLGKYLGLTGRIIKGKDLLYTKHADFLADKESWGKIEKLLFSYDWNINNINEDLYTILKCNLKDRIDLNIDTDKYRDIINLFEPDELEDVIFLLDKEDEWDSQLLQDIKKLPPEACLLTFEVIKRAKSMTLLDCFKMELDVSLNIVRTHNFFEGVRTTLVDKDAKPDFIPKELKEVSKKTIDKFFKYDYGFEDNIHPIDFYLDKIEDM